MSPAHNVTVGPVTFGNDLPFVLIAGPCQIESRDHAMAVAGELVSICRAAGVPLVFKSSYDKANRTSLGGARGVGMAHGLAILAGIREALGCPVLTDIHSIEQVKPASEAVDILQIPAFLCRQTDLLLAAGETGRAVNVAAKIASTGNERILLTERGASFGYNTLVTDFRSLPIMAETGYPVVFDATHSVQQPGGQGGSSGGERKYAPVLARAALAVGCAAIFMECHPDPDHAPSDGPNMIPLAAMPAVIDELLAVDRLMKARR